jgi:acyl-CoA synthetase (NDP forming)
MPCCTVCKECGNNVIMGKMRSHALESHGVTIPPASPEKINELKELLSEFSRLIGESDAN